MEQHFTRYLNLPSELFNVPEKIQTIEDLIKLNF